MMRHLLELGRALYPQGNPAPEELVDGLVQGVEEGTLYLLDIYPEKKCAKLTPFELNEEKCRRFLWVGDPPQSNAPRDRVTTRELRYLLGQVPGALVRDPGLRQRLGHLIWRVGTGKHGYLLDLRGYSLLNAKDVPLKEEQDPKKKNPFWVERGVLRAQKGAETVEKPGDRLAETLKAAWGVQAARGKELLFSLAIDGTPVAEWPEYRDYLARLLLNSPFQGAKEGICHGCGKPALVTPETSFFRYKFYITDKKSFAPGLVGEAFPKALALCQTCFASVLLGERFAERKLEIPFLGRRALVLPEGEGNLTLEALGNRVNRLLAQVRGLERVEAWRDFLQRLGPGTRADFLGFSLVLFERKRASTKIQEAVYEVPPSRVEALFQAMGESRWLGPWGGEVGGLGDWLDLLGEEGYALALKVAVHLLEGIPLERSSLLPQLLGKARRDLWAASRGPTEVLELLARGAGWIWVLRRLGMLREEERETRKALEVAEEFREGFEGFKERLEKYGFDPLQAGLYLLGVALEMVGNAQAQPTKYKKEPLLETIGWEGMSLLEVRYLAQRATDRAAYYLEKDLTWFLRLVGMATDLMERGGKGLSQREIPYYLLMGYAQARARRLEAGKSKEQGTQEVAHDH